MAPTWSTPRDELSCPICHDVFKDPVLLCCSHSFCNICVKTWWGTTQHRLCPVCKAPSFTQSPLRNLALKNMCEAFLLEEESGVVCRLHAERLKLFCLDHQTPICVVCRDSIQHANHRFRPVDEAAESHRKDLRAQVARSREKVEIFNKVKRDIEKADEEIRNQALATETDITHEFNVLVQFLMLDKEFRIAALKEEETRKRKVFKDKIASLTGEVIALESTIKTIEDGLREDDAALLLNVGALTRAAQRPLPEDPELLTGAQIDVAKHLGNMTFNTWCKMKPLVSYTPVILNPNTAHPKLQLSEGLTSAKCRHDPASKAIVGHCSALGSEGFTSGRHSWDVEVGRNKMWALGVIMAPDAHKMGDVVSGLWMLRFNKGTFSVFSPSHPLSVLPLREQPRRVRVQLDCDIGTLSFLDLDTDALIYTFKQAFADKLFPYVNTRDTLQPLKMLPVDLTMTIEATRLMVQLKK
ncbi:E3 ubiquitin-protein ligase TRIM35-like [Clinocottus analis]|uniref:E3 ubiquitin-protein ligase TRIM35-like n=1 Tax=Clinocottus analis TaxID=304258 RepID=UPI0035BFBB7C